jgi:hypothetical protein
VVRAGYRTRRPLSRITQRYTRSAMWCPICIRSRSAPVMPPSPPPLGIIRCRTISVNSRHSAETDRSAAFRAFSLVRFTESSPTFSASARRSHLVFQFIVGEMFDADKGINARCWRG